MADINQTDVVDQTDVDQTDVVDKTGVVDKADVDQADADKTDIDQTDVINQPAVEKADFAKDWRAWMKENVSKEFDNHPNLKAELDAALKTLYDNKLYTATEAQQPHFLRSWQRLRGVWDAPWPPPPGSVPSAVDCEVVRLLTHGNILTKYSNMHKILEKHGWNFIRCCNPNLTNTQKREFPPIIPGVTEPDEIGV